MAFQPDLNPQPVSGTVSVTGSVNATIVGTPSVTVSGTVNIGDQPIDVNVSPTTVEDTNTYSNDTLGTGSLNGQFVASNITVGSTLEILALTVAVSATGELYKISFKTRSSGTDLVVGYFTTQLSLVPNVRFTIPDTSDDNLFVQLDRIGSGIGTSGSVSVVYRITAP